MGCRLASQSDLPSMDYYIVKPLVPIPAPLDPIPAPLDPIPVHLDPIRVPLDPITNPNQSKIKSPIGTGNAHSKKSLNDPLYPSSQQY